VYTLLRHWHLTFVWQLKNSRRYQTPDNGLISAEITQAVKKLLHSVVLALMPVLKKTDKCGEK
jgi:hypothetical protein